jgi:tetratricopeptide (TPR) repeat protein
MTIIRSRLKFNAWVSHCENFPFLLARIDAVMLMLGSSIGNDKMDISDISIEMKNYLLPIAIFGTIAQISYVSPAVALSPVEIQRIAKQTTVQITGCDFGSGVIIRKNGSTYTVLTVAHAVKKSGCEVATPDDSKYQVSQVKTFPDVDLAVFTFTSNKNYPVAKLIDNSDRVEAAETIYVSGFPLSTAINSSVFTFVKGDVVANPANKQQGKGYSLIYSNNTLPGQSGGPVWNDKGEVIAIHGQGDVDTKLGKTVNDNVRVKTGYNLGITVNTFTKLATVVGIGGYTPVAVAAKPKPVDDLIASAIQKESQGDYSGMVADMDRAIAIEPQRGVLYFNRGVAKNGLKDIKGAISDYDRAISLNPNDTGAYKNRSLLKSELGDNRSAIDDASRAIALKPNDFKAYNLRSIAKIRLGDKRGAISDANRAIAINASDSSAYVLRATAKVMSGEYQGGLADLNRAIALNPDDGTTFQLRGALKSVLKDKQGAIADLRQAAKLYQQRGKTDNYQKIMAEIDRLGGS